MAALRRHMPPKFEQSGQIESIPRLILDDRNSTPETSGGVPVLGCSARH